MGGGGGGGGGGVLETQGNRQVSCKKMHQSTCSLVFSPFSAYFYPPMNAMDKGLLYTHMHKIHENMHVFMYMYLLLH